jgi:hypothetical protein
MALNRYLFAGILLLTFITLNAQQTGNGWCGYTGKSAWLTWYQQHQNQIVTNRDLDTSTLYVPVTVHIIADDNGAGGYSTSNAIRAVCEMNDHYQKAHIHFFLVPGDPFRYVSKSSWFKHDWTGGSEMINDPANKLPGRLNAYVVADPAGNCGYSWQDAIVLGSNCSGAGNSTWSHEAGHHLSLPHPFLGWEGFTWDYAKPAPAVVNGRGVEKTDGSNCHDAGDGFCDTPPDYLNYRWDCGADDHSTIQEKDPDSIAFHSDASLIMGYALDACANRFTTEQIAAMRANLNSEHAIYSQTAPSFVEIPDDAVVIPVSPVGNQTVQFNNITMTWNPIPDATIYAVEVGLYPNFSPILFSQTLINQVGPGQMSVTITKPMPNNRTLYWRVHPYNEWDICQPIDTFITGVFRTQNLLATNELEKVLTAELAPNPVASGMPAILSIVSDEGLEGTLYVADMSGKKYTQVSYRITPGDNQIEIPTTDLAAGAYVVILQNAKGVLVKHLAVVR